MINMFSNSYEEHKSMEARIELLEILAEAEDEVSRITRAAYNNVTMSDYIPTDEDVAASMARLPYSTR